jgi:hypothetical protein
MRSGCATGRAGTLDGVPAAACDLNSIMRPCAAEIPGPAIGPGLGFGRRPCRDHQRGLPGHGSSTFVAVVVAQQFLRMMECVGSRLAMGGMRRGDPFGGAVLAKAIRGLGSWPTVGAVARMRCAGSGTPWVVGSARATANGCCTTSPAVPVGSADSPAPWCKWRHWRWWSCYSRWDLVGSHGWACAAGWYWR